MDRLLIVRLGSLGDVVHTLPAVHVLRQAFPETTIGWAIEERWSELLAAASCGDSQGTRPLVDALHLINARAWRRALLSDETWREIISEMLALRSERYDVAIDFQGLWKSAALALWSGAAERVGFDRPRERPASLFYTKRVVTSAAHIVEQNLELALALAPHAACDVSFPIPLAPVADAWCQAELSRRGISRFVLISAGGGWGAKLWPAGSFAAVARALCANGVPSLLNCGPGEDALVREIEENSGGAAQAVRCSLAELVALSRRACLFIGGDTGPTHLAAALGTPVVALFGPTDPVRNGPYGARRIVLRSGESATSYSHVSRRDPGLLSVTPEQVICAARQLLGTTG